MKNESNVIAQAKSEGAQSYFPTTSGNGPGLRFFREYHGQWETCRWQWQNKSFVQ